MRTYEDQLQMRELYTEHDLISAEIQNISQDFSLSLHTRSLKYGKLENGQFLSVCPSLIPRLPQHYVSLPLASGVDVLLGRNGNIWVTRSMPVEWREQEGEGGETEREGGVTLVETLQRLRIRHRETSLLREEREMVARVSNAVRLCGQERESVSPEMIMRIVKRSEKERVAVKDMLSAENSKLLLSSSLSLSPAHDGSSSLE
eukprot:CAMPEP_0182421312 /NCGR_PEP_ID=MMETSP1167-20130531/6643_1 /TAXON_ID=2988 /ORGANISM="Mallomonas Sp, Strain CCMP3275" /LENGTH=202 /DNA_ID=CAMNT_0024598319 /DNA_START=448 /DNA_END=1056 /DNA_ORIENTATION=+